MKKKYISIIRNTLLCRLLLCVAMVSGQWSMTGLYAQISIGGNVYGGGNAGNVDGSTKVTVRAGNIGARPLDEEEPTKDPRGKVFGGARMANVGGNSFVHIDGENATDYIIINQVFGGNDVAGQIGTGKVPEEIDGNKDGKDDAGNNVDNTWNSFVRFSSNTSDKAVHFTQEEIDAAHEGDPAFGKTTSDIKIPANKKVFVGQAYASGNGYYDYDSDSDGNGNVTHYIYNKEDHTTPIATTVTPDGEVGFQQPELDKAYLDIEGGTIDYAYGGGNSSTVRVENVIYMNQHSEDVVTHIWVDSEGKEVAKGTAGAIDLLDGKRLKEMGINSFFSNIESEDFQIGRLFGGNNLAEMNIMPRWNLQQGKVRNLYNGGNKGAMTYNRGLLLDINPKADNPLHLVVDNVYGGCRMADVRPLKPGTREDEIEANIKLDDIDYHFPDGFAARVLVRGGDINNVYGGNDVTGKVYGGNAVGIYASIGGDVYGGGNGAYPYTDNSNLEDTDMGDLYYDPTAILENEGVNVEDVNGMKSVTALNLFRPNAEQVSIRLAGKVVNEGTENEKIIPTIIRGSVFVGGNCATLSARKSNPTAEIKIGSHVIADKLFLGNNGEDMINENKMIKENILKFYAGRVKDGKLLKNEDEDESLITDENQGEDFSTIDLTVKEQMAAYMEGVVMALKPNIVFDGVVSTDPAVYKENSSYVGSLYLGGNVGSMGIAGNNSYTINHGLNIYEKFVGGCNDADVEKGLYNAAYEGGVLGSKTAIGDNNQTVNEREEEEDGNTKYYDLVEGKKIIKDRLEINLEHLTITPLRWGDKGLIWNTQKWGDVYTAIAEGTELKVGDVYYTYTPYTEHTVTGENYTVTASDNFFTKGEGDEYTKITTGIVLEVGVKYYTYTANNYTEHTVSGESITADGTQFSKGDQQDFVEVPNSPIDEDVRLLGGNVYGGCYNSGHVNGNVVININEDVLKRDEVFGTGEGPYGRKASGIELEDQRDDLNALALTVFGAGYGEGTEIWGSTTVNLNKGYAFQIFGGGEEGVVGKRKKDGGIPVLDAANNYIYEFDPRYSSTVNLKGGVTVNLEGTEEESSEGEVTGLAETEYIYGGGNEGDVCGNTYVNLGNGRIYDAFGGASDADILGHTEVYIGRQPNGSGGYKDGFPWIRDIVYGGNDFGGTIHGEFETGYDFTKRVRDYSAEKTKIHGYKVPGGNQSEEVPDVLKGVSYVEYLQGRVDTIFGGSYGNYDYTNTALYGTGKKMPSQESAYVNIRPKYHEKNFINGVFGAGTGYPDIRSNDNSQHRSYVLIDIPKHGNGYVDNFKRTEIFGSGSYNGLGMDELAPLHGAEGYDEYMANIDSHSAIIDLLDGKIGNVFGGSYNEGVTRRTVVNVPVGSSIWMFSDEQDYDDPPTNQIKHEKKYGSIYGGAYGTQILPPCDVFESVVNYKSDQAIVNGAIFGGNNNERRTLRTQVNISAPVWSTPEKATKGFTACVYGAGQGVDTWAEYTEVNLLPGAKVYEAYGGGMMGHVLNAQSVEQYMYLYRNGPSAQIGSQDPYWKEQTDIWESEGILKDAYKARWQKDWKDAWTLGKYYTPATTGDNAWKGYASNPATNLDNVAERTELATDAKGASQLGNANKKYNTNVIISQGATVSGYAYAGGYGKKATALSGDVYGTTYLALLGGTVSKDIYGGGTAGSVDDLFGTDAYDGTSNPNGFTASSNVYILGGTARNVYGGGWQGNIGAQKGHAGLTKDYPGATHVVIGKTGSDSFTGGNPAVQRNAYGGGEGGKVFGTANITLNNGYIGYVHLSATEKQNEKGEIVAATTEDNLAERYEEKIDDETYYENDAWAGKDRLEDCGNIYGSGYDDVSGVDNTNVSLYGGLVRNCVFGGGEVATVGRGSRASVDATEVTITKAGKTNVTMYNGHVLKNVYGGGKGYNKLKYGESNNLYTDGYVFGQTCVNIHGGEIGTEKAVKETTEIGSVGNVFGGGDAGVVYSAYELADGTLAYGKKSGERYNDGDEGYYYKYENGTYKQENGEKVLTEDCKVVIEPWLQVKAEDGISYNDKTYAKDDYVPTAYLNTLPGTTGGASWPAAWDVVNVGTPAQERGVIIHNGVFAGGNTPVGNSAVSANGVTIYGNATASIHDVYNRDLITIGTGHVGGLYGDGNLTFVDGYRELNITNYGTDFYHIKREIDRATYDELYPREQDYYEIRYKCKKKCHDKDGTEYHPEKTNSDGDIVTNASTIAADEMELLFLIDVTENNVKKKVSVEVDPTTGNVVPTGTAGAVAILNYVKNDKDEWIWVPNSDYWTENGLRSRYAGRPMNTIQRADFCGVFGSRMVMQGAEDRVLTVADHTNYTINRVREVSLNKKKFNPSDTEPHGNYFGIYSKVNYLGALTSDFDFGDETHRTDIRLTDNKDDKFKVSANDIAYGTSFVLRLEERIPQGQPPQQRP